MGLSYVSTEDNSESSLLFYSKFFYSPFYYYCSEYMINLSNIIDFIYDILGLGYSLTLTFISRPIK